MNAVIEAPSRVVTTAQTAAEVRAQINRIQEVMRAVMQKDTHYGVIPGTPKPTLYKAGSEVLLTTFRIAVDPIVEDLSTHDEVRYRVIARGVHQATGTVIGAGVGECSSNEEKYRWRNAVCDEEFDETPEDRKRIKWQKGRDNAYQRAQIRTVPADVANTVLKMAKKRAQIDLTLTALAASDCFTQDIEDLPEELREVADHDGAPESNERARGRPQTQAPRSRHAAAQNGNAQSTRGRATEKQVKLVGVKLDNAGIPEVDFLRRFQISAIAELSFDKVNEALAWIANPDDGGDREADIGDGQG